MPTKKLRGEYMRDPKGKGSMRAGEMERIKKWRAEMPMLPEGRLEGREVDL
jgi:hypothetical protein